MESLRLGKNMKEEKIKNKLVKEVSENHAKIIDDFVKVYLSSRWKDYFSKQINIDFRRIELVIKQDGTTTTYFCRLRRGKLPIRKQLI